MCFIAANATGKPAVLPARDIVLAPPGRAPRLAFVEDLNWPGPAPAQKKSQRPIEVWAPGPVGSWEGEVPSLQ